MWNYMDELLLLHRLGVQGVSCKAHKIVQAHWLLPSGGWIKVNTDGATNGAPGMNGGNGIFALVGC